MKRLLAETSARGPSSATRGVDALTGLNRRREMGFVGTAPRGLLYLFGERYAWARPPRLISAGPGPSRSFYNESFKMIQTRRDAVRRRGLGYYSIGH